MEKSKTQAILDSKNTWISPENEQVGYVFLIFNQGKGIAGHNLALVGVFRKIVVITVWQPVAFLFVTFGAGWVVDLAPIPVGVVGAVSVVPSVSA